MEILYNIFECVELEFYVSHIPRLIKASLRYENLSGMIDLSF